MTRKHIVRALLMQRPVILGVYTLLFLWTLLFLLPGVCQDMVYSAFYEHHDEDIVRYTKLAIEQNDRRLRSAHTYLDEFLDSHSTEMHKMKQGLILANPATYTGHGGSLAIVLVAKNREQTAGNHRYNPGYLTQAVAALHRAGREAKYFNSKLFFICNVDQDPDSFQESSLLADFAVVFSKYKSTTRVENADNDDVIDLYEKQKLDYVYCLEKALNHTAADYVIALEDDVIVNERFFEFLHHHLYNNLAHKLERGIVDADSWAYIKLSHPSRWRGFSWSLDSASELITCAVLGGAACLVLWIIVANVISRVCDTFLVRLLTMSCHRLLSSLRFKMKLSYRSLSVRLIYVLGAAFTGTVCYAIGRPYLQQLRLFSPHLQRLTVNAPGCCTLAMLYPRAAAYTLVRYLKSMTCNIDFALDSAVDEFARVHSLETFIVEPNIAVHVGLVSSLRSYAKFVAEYLDINLI